MILGTCHGCDQPEALSLFSILHHSGERSEALYCSDCEDLARMDWNGETAVVDSLPLTIVLPSSFAPFARVDWLSPSAIRLDAWPERVYAGSHLSGGLGRIPFLPAARS